MDQVQIEMALDKNYLVPDKIQKAYLMVKLTAPYGKCRNTVHSYLGQINVFQSM